MSIYIKQSNFNILNKNVTTNSPKMALFPSGPERQKINSKDPSSDGLERVDCGYFA